jgi:PAS domain S-box-containing protein
LIARSSEQLIGLRIGETGTTKDISPLRNFYNEVLDGGVAKRAEIRLEHTDRIAYYDIYAEPLRDEKGEITGLMSVSTDITERKKAEEAVKQSKQRLQDVLESISDDLYSLDADWNFIYVNKRLAKDWGYEPEELIGKNFWKVFPRFIGAAVEKNFYEAMQKRETRYFEWNPLYTVGFREITVFPSAEGITVYGKNITERKQLQIKLEEYAKDLEKLVEERTRQLKDAERLATVGQVAGMVGHDIRNPLQAINNELYIVRESVSASEKLSESDVLKCVDFIQEQVDYIDKIVSDLQDYAKILKPQLVEVDICRLIPEALKTVHIPEKIQALLACEEGIPPLRLDLAFIRRVLTNLVINCVQAMPDGGKMTIHVFKEGDNAIITVEDTGIGIPDEVKPKLFTPLFTTKAKGQGFGLPVVKRMIEALGGTINFESQVGKGTKFIVSLPIRKF